MRLLSFETPDPGRPERRLGALLDVSGVEHIVDLRLAYLGALADEGVGTDEAQRLAGALLPARMEAFVDGGRSCLHAARQALEFAAGVGSQPSPGSFRRSEVRVLSPFTQPNSLRDFVGFEDHARAGASGRGEELQTWYERPFYYKGNHRSIVGPDCRVMRPRFTEELDFELEVACVLGGAGRDLDESKAADAIFGFTIMNDWSARDVQRLEMASRLGPAKSKDFATSLGPCVLVDEQIGPHPPLGMAARVNGRVICEANLGDAYWTFPQMIALVSTDEWVWPTDVYGSGTPFRGCMLDRGGPYLQPGDVVELEVEGIGILRNQVA